MLHRRPLGLLLSCAAMVLTAVRESPALSIGRRSRPTNPVPGGHAVDVCARDLMNFPDVSEWRMVATRRDEKGETRLNDDLCEQS